MVRARIRPAPPRALDPDLPREFAPATLSRSGETSDARIALDPGATDAAYSRISESVVASASVEGLDLTGAILTDVDVTGCRIGTLDLPGARVERMRIAGSTVDEMDVREWQAGDVDLRGADVLSFTDVRMLRGVTVTAGQATSHALAFAASLGIDVRDAG